MIEINILCDNDHDHFSKKNHKKRSPLFCDWDHVILAERQLIRQVLIKDEILTS